MDLNDVRRVSSAGYRLPDRSGGTRPVTTRPPADRTRSPKGAAVTSEPDPDQADPVKQDRVWRQMVWTERRGIREWEKNWSFLKDYGQMVGNQEEPLPSYVPLFSDRIPNTTNQMFGSRLSTPLGSELVKLDRLLLWSGSHQRSKHDPEMLPC
uniref:Si:dkey-18j18.3 n=1 Tax=Echeneis naucrates TaxID=173247 RepID=A0A665V8E0_ECHNA